ncbi:putative membrane protein YfcA [Microbacteriaceae bacterium SG_E_30_P1]|uniref:Probable membrane transporter protein n=1 Tax=Antiquaquibacter oligotrophicus TaxID=2880260 RepID=A0ABT6KR00_9MICO|nr:sulfite exporter TauE/SafE family protein [Antiquaquibacter oligotrophicus]MDH6182405.1 putative membrane protein YfcA [Antiquaquibacter oligotrophicus]UDF14623.1 sulfite exporter TauE/SafE family protein [Antiquaquibacter oligotrophicus]
MTRRILALIGVGVLGGFLSGTFGIGGGILMVPLLIWLIKLDQRHAAALSLAAVLPAAIVGAVTYGFELHVDYIAGALVAAGGIVGALIGTRLLRRLPLGWLRWMFVVLLVLVAVRMLIVVPETDASIDITVWSVIALIGLGLLVGIASGLFGIGGGVIIVPALVGLFGVSELIAKGTSLLAMIPTSVTGTISNARARLVSPLDGFILGVAAALAAYPGVVVAHLMPTLVSHILFAVLVLFAATQLAIRAWRMRKQEN